MISLRCRSSFAPLTRTIRQEPRSIYEWMRFSLHATNREQRMCHYFTLRGISKNVTISDSHKMQSRLRVDCDDGSSPTYREVTKCRRCSGYVMVNGLLRRNAIKTTAQFCGVNKPPSVFAGIFALTLYLLSLARLFSDYHVNRVVHSWFVRSWQTLLRHRVLSLPRTTFAVRSRRSKPRLDWRSRDRYGGRKPHG